MIGEYGVKNEMEKTMHEMSYKEAMAYLSETNPPSFCRQDLGLFYIKGFLAASEIYEAKLMDFCISLECSTIGLSADQIDKIIRALYPEYYGKNLKELDNG